MLHKIIRIKKDRGQSFVELGISLSFLLVLLAGVADIGRAYFIYISLRDSVQEGASYLAMAPVNSSLNIDCDGAFKRIRDHSSTPVNLNDSAILISISLQHNSGSSATWTTFSCVEGSATSIHGQYICPGDEITVTITDPNIAIATPFIGSLIGRQTYTLQAAVSDGVLADPIPNYPTKTTDVCNP